MKKSGTQGIYPLWALQVLERNRFCQPRAIDGPIKGISIPAHLPGIDQANRIFPCRCPTFSDVSISGERCTSGFRGAVPEPRWNHKPIGYPVIQHVRRFSLGKLHIPMAGVALICLEHRPARIKEMTQFLPLLPPNFSGMSRSSGCFLQIPAQIVSTSAQP